MSMIRSLMWMVTLALAFASMGIGLDADFAGATMVSYVLGLIAFFACPLVWGRPDGLAPHALRVPAKVRLTLTIALIAGSPLLLPWQLWF